MKATSICDGPQDKEPGEHAQGGNMRRPDLLGGSSKVFSSGLWGSCEMYTQLCRDLASGGAIVVAIEHEDGSGLHAVDGTSGQRIAYVRPPNGSDPRVFRRPFLETRAEELRHAAAALASAAGQQAGAPAAAEERPGAEALAALLRCGDPDRMLLVGHSFGASSAVGFLRRLRERGEPCPYKGVLLMDFWSECLEEADFARPQVPVAMLLSEEWQRSPKLVAGLRALAEACGDRMQAAAVCPGTRHQWVSESHLFLPARVLRRIGIMGPAEHARSYRATARAALLAAEQLLAAGGGGGGADASAEGAAAARLRAELAEVDREAVRLFE
ncbi:unnamed protein product [Prorocentrum cordatum]|uniref:1-alkyl-2-acetylglycerophosphocholine esterase n=1 Tax=Prorocentrum cordatum TaxID=2364126 RepID=A0ABN9VAM2_9DINO|nr:unnamed protein product [Polarella glacialis]